MRPRQASFPAVLCLLVTTCTPGSADVPADFQVIAQLDVGLNPHRISLSEDGRTAYIATAGESDQRKPATFQVLLDFWLVPCS